MSKGLSDYFFQITSSLYVACLIHFSTRVLIVFRVKFWSYCYRIVADINPFHLIVMQQVNFIFHVWRYFIPGSLIILVWVYLKNNYNIIFLIIKSFDTIHVLICHFWYQVIVNEFRITTYLPYRYFFRMVLVDCISWNCCWFCSYTWRLRTSFKGL